MSDLLVTSAADTRDDVALDDAVNGEARAVNVLMITHRTPYPPDKGDRIRTYHILKHLAQRADVDLATLADEPVSGASAAALDELTRRHIIVPVAKRARWLWGSFSLARGRSATEGLFYSAELARRLREWTASTRYDAVVIVCSSMAQYLTSMRTPPGKTLVDLIDVDSQKWFDYAHKSSGMRKLLYRLEGRRVSRLEQSIARQCDAVIVVTPAEAACLPSDGPCAMATAVPNGVDLDYYYPNDDARETRNSCVFVGALDYAPNVDAVTWFCDQVWPQVLGARPDAKFSIVGRRPTAAVQQLTSRPGVEVVADPPDVRPYLWKSSVVVAPLRIARGVQNKVLEALAAGKPVVGSPQAITGIDVTIDEHLCEASTPDSWSATLLRLMANKRERSELGAAGRRFVCERHHWESCLKPLDGLLGLNRGDGAVGQQRRRATVSH